MENIKKMYALVQVRMAGAFAKSRFALSNGNKARVSLLYGER